MAFQNTQLRVKNQHERGNSAPIESVLVVAANTNGPTDVASAARLRLDWHATANATHSYVLQLDRVQSGANAHQSPVAFIAVGEQETANAKVSFLFDLGGRPGMNVAANSGILTTLTPGTVTGAIRIRINGATRYIAFSSTAA